MKIFSAKVVVLRWSLWKISAGACVSVFAFFKQYETELIWCSIGAGGMFLVMMTMLLIRRKKKSKPSKTSGRDIENDTGTFHRVALTDQTDSMKTFRCDFKTTIIVGRNPNMCTLLIGGDNSISGKHCGIYVKSGVFYVKDLDSSNGTKVNGIPLAGECEIHSGDIIKLGRREYLVELE